MESKHSDENPFAPPAVESRPIPVVQRPSLRALIFIWMLMFCLNLPLPIIFGLAVTKSSGNVGMILGCIIVNVTGLWLCRTSPHFMLRLCAGSLVVAVSQFFSVLHVFVGAAAIEVSRWLFNPLKGSPTGDLTRIDQVTFVTILTGIGLILPSIAIGYLVGIFFNLPTSNKVRVKNDAPTLEADRSAFVDS